MHIPEHLKHLYRQAKSEGWSVTVTGSGHLRWAPPEGRAVITGSTSHRKGFGRDLEAGRVELAAKPRPRVDWARVSEAVADRERERDEARTRLAALRELLDEIGVMAANAPEDGDSFGVLEEITMRIAAADVPDRLESK